MTPDFLQGFFRVGIFVSLVSLVLVLSTQRDSAEFVISFCSLLIGLTLVGLIVLVTRIGQR
jgi:hypothetical protein